MTEQNPLPTAPATPTDTPATPAYDATQPPRRGWRDRLPSGRKAVAAGAVVAGLAIGGAGFGAGYAVGDSGSTDVATTRTGQDWTPDGDQDGRGFPGDGRGPMGEMPGGGQMGGFPGGTTDGQGGTTGEAPDFDGDGQPDTDSGTDDGSTSDSATQNS